MCWLLDDSAFESANDSTSVPIGKLRKCLSLAECIVSVSKNKFTSFHLGFALQINNIDGSTNPVDILQSWIVCILSRGKTLSYKHYWPCKKTENRLKKGHMESYQPMVRPTLSRREQIILTLTQKPLMEKTPSIQCLELCFKCNRPLTGLLLVQSNAHQIVPFI